MKNYSFFGFIVLLITILGACNLSEKTGTNSDIKVIDNPKLYAEGFNLVNQNCITCHSPSASIDNRIAPPLAAVKTHYLDDTETKEEFVNQMVDFTLKPDVENSKMPKAVKRFNLMPVLGYSREQLEKVANYLYHAEVEKPNWFDEQYAKEKEVFLKYTSDDIEDYLKKGLGLALSTKAILGKNLMGAIKSKGTSDALGFCNIKAIPLTDSMSMRLNAKIRRVSDKSRNPDNAANADELAYIQKAKLDITEIGQASPQTVEKDALIIGYYPIMTNGMCLQCHGNPGEEIREETLKRIDDLYPADKARGYRANELRGIWVVEMENK